MIVRINHENENILTKKVRAEVKQKARFRKLYKSLEETVLGRKDMMNEGDFDLVRKIINETYDSEDKVKHC